MKYVFPFIIYALLASCFNEGDCLVTATNLVHIQFKSKKTLRDTLVTFSYYSVKDEKDNIIKASEILLPLNVNQDSVFTQFIFKRMNPVDSTVYATHTLKIKYDKQTKVISKDCGAYTFYQNLKVVKSTLHPDSAAIKTPNTSLVKNPTGSALDPTSYAINFQILY